MLRESISKQVDKMSRVPMEERRVWSSQGGGKDKGFHQHSLVLVTFLVAQLVNNSPAMQKTWVRSVGWEDPPEKGKATHSSILRGIPRIVCPWGRKE